MTGTVTGTGIIAPTITLPRPDAAALAELLRTLETVLDMHDTAVADALDDHFGCDGAADILFAAAGMHAEALQTLLTTPTQQHTHRPAEHSEKTETTR